MNLVANLPSSLPLHCLFLLSTRPVQTKKEIALMGKQTSTWPSKHASASRTCTTCSKRLRPLFDPHSLCWEHIGYSQAKLANLQTFNSIWLTMEVTVEEFTLYGEAGLALTQPRVTSPEFKEGSPHVSMTAGEALAQNTTVQAEGNTQTGRDIFACF